MLYYKRVQKTAPLNSTIAVFYQELVFFSNVGSRVWVTSKLYGCNHASSHEEISVKDLNNGQPVFEVPECIQIKDVSKHTITISNVTPTHKITTQFVAPVQEFHIHQKAVSSVISENLAFGFKSCCLYLCLHKSVNNIRVNYDAIRLPLPA